MPGSDRPNWVVAPAIASAGGILPLVALVRNGATEEQMEWAARALWFLAVSNDANRAAIVSAGGIRPLVALVRDGTTDEQKLYAAGALKEIAHGNPANSEANRSTNAANRAANRAAIADAGGIPPLKALWRNGTEKQKRQALFALSIFSEH